MVRILRPFVVAAPAAAVGDDSMQVIMQVWSCDWCATPHSLGELKAEGPNGIGTLCSDCGLAFQQRLDREKVAPAADVDAPADDKGLAMAEPAEQEPAADWYQAGAASDQEQSANAAVAQAVGGAVLSNALASRPWIGELLGRVKERASALGLKEAKSGPWGEFMSPPGGYIRPQLTTLRPTVLANVQAYTGNYMSMGAGWCVVSVLFHPFLLFVGAAIYMVSRHVLGDREITVAGRTLSMPEKKIGVAGVTVSAVLLTGAITTLLWIMAFAFLLCMVHASMHSPPAAAVASVIELEPMLGADETSPPVADTV